MWDSLARVGISFGSFASSTILLAPGAPLVELLPVQIILAQAKPALISNSIGLRWSRYGRELRSCKPTIPSTAWRFTLLRTVRGLTPKASLMAFDIRRLVTEATFHSRPRAVRRAFLWTFIRSPFLRTLKLRRLQLLPAGVGWTAYRKLTSSHARDLLSSPPPCGVVTSLRQQAVCRMVFVTRTPGRTIMP